MQWLNAHVAWIVVPLFLAGVALGIVVMIKDWLSKRPTFEFMGVKVRYLPGAIRNDEWDNNTRLMIRACYLSAIQIWGDKAQAAADGFQILWYPKNKEIVSVRQSDHAKRFAGLWEAETVIWWSRPTAHVLQSKPDRPDNQHADLDQTALAHEFMLHGYPGQCENNENVNHDPKYAPYELQAHETYKIELTKGV